ncbi:MAG: hypothetical protein LQ346_005259 [Caloplaca aetnensis]|nr:MAG: hypothetical protein LQ346_005259 [Caloplaca aetnensis]
MHPLKPAHLQPDFLAQKPILLLNTTILPIRSLVRCIIADAFPGAAGKLPTEIWLNIIEYTKPEDAKYEAVQPTAIVQSNRGIILHCQVVDLDIGDFPDRAEVEAAEQWLQSSHAYDQQRQDEDTFAAKVVTGKTNAIFFPIPSASPGSSVPALRVPDCLFTAITVPDVVSWLQNGHCWVCAGDRDICPGYTGGKAQQFDALLGCGESLAWPLYMGLELMDEEDKAFLEKYYWDAPPPTRKRRETHGCVRSGLS